MNFEQKNCAYKNQIDSQKILKISEPSKTILPDHWSPMSADDNLITIPLNRSKQEYTNIVSKLKGELAGHLTVSNFEVSLSELQLL